MWRSLAVGFAPYILMVAGVPVFNSGADVIGLPELGLWILIWVVLSPLFLAVAHRLLPEAERREEWQP